MREESAIIFFFMMVFGFAAFVRFLDYRKTIFLAERGLVEPELRTGKGLLVWGLIITFVGVALCFGLFFVGWSEAPYEGYPFRLGPWMLGGFIPLSIGLAMLLAHQLTKDDREPMRGTAPREAQVPNGVRRSADEAMSLELPGSTLAGGSTEPPQGASGL